MAKPTAAHKRHASKARAHLRAAKDHLRRAAQHAKDDPAAQAVINEAASITASADDCLDGLGSLPFLSPDDPDWDDDGLD